MGERDPFGGFEGKFETLGGSLQEADKRPLIGLTQGGSSRKGGGAKSAARDATGDGTQKVSNGKTKKG